MAEPAREPAPYSLAPQIQLVEAFKKEGRHVIELCDRYKPGTYALAIGYYRVPVKPTRL